MDDRLPIREALQRYYAEHGLPPDGGADQAWFLIRIGRVGIPMPNPGIRRRALLYHDAHHIVTGYNTVFSQGEMVIAGHEIGAGCGRFAVAWVINLWMFALGLLVMPRRLFTAFIRGRRCGSLYREAGRREAILTMTVGEVRRDLGLDQPAPRATGADRAAFALWCCAAWLVTLAFAGAGAAVAWAVVWGAGRLLTG